MKNFSEKTKRRIELLRRLKKQRELVMKQAFDRARGKADAIRRRLTDMENSLTEQTRAVRRMILSGGPVDLRCYAMSVRDARRAMALHAEQLADAEKSAETARNDFLAARQQREAADLLADRAARGEAVSIRRSEARELDEIAAAETETVL